VAEALQASKGGAAARKLASEFLEFLLSPEVQAMVPKTNWMLPVRKDVPLPESFAKIPKPKKIVRLDSSAAEITNALGDWAKSVQMGH
jgi:thiamine transport system substrate-binding protein